MADSDLPGGLERSERPATIDEIVDEARRYALACIHKLAHPGEGAPGDGVGPKGRKKAIRSAAGAGLLNLRMLLEIGRVLGPEVEELGPRKRQLSSVPNLSDPVALEAARQELIRRRQQASGQ